MSDQTPLLSLPLIQAAQAQKHVTHNEAIEQLDMVVQLTVEAVDATTPPSGAAEGQAWAVGTGATGAWAGRGGQVAAWRGNGWLFAVPQTGWRAWNKAAAATYAFDGNAWVYAAGAPDLQNLVTLGINATADATNRFAVSSDATLLTHDGTDHQLKINKAGETDTASLLYQTNWSGRAEMGLNGDNDFSVKVSGDGASFTEALRVEATTGVVALPKTGTRQLMPYNYRFSFYTDKRWMGHSVSAASLNATQSLGTGTNPIIDWDAKGLFLPAGTQINEFIMAGTSNSSNINDLNVRIYFQHGPWNAAWKNASDVIRVTLTSDDDIGMSGGDGMQSKRYSLNYITPDDGFFLVNAQPNAASVLSATRYFYSAGALDVTLPPSG